jgi:hypothetical protein
VVGRWVRGRGKRRKIIGLVLIVRLGWEGGLVEEGRVWVVRCRRTRIGLGREVIGEGGKEGRGIEGQEVMRKRLKLLIQIKVEAAFKSRLSSRCGLLSYRVRPVRQDFPSLPLVQFRTRHSRRDPTRSSTPRVPQPILFEHRSNLSVTSAQVRASSSGCGTRLGGRVDGSQTGSRVGWKGGKEVGEGWGEGLVLIWGVREGWEGVGGHGVEILAKAEGNIQNDQPEMERDGLV